MWLVYINFHRNEILKMSPNFFPSKASLIFQMSPVTRRRHLRGGILLTKRKIPVSELLLLLKKKKKEKQKNKKERIQNEVSLLFLSS